MKSGGFVARYMGDGILAYFGYPQAHEEDAERAVRTGLELIEAAAKLDDGAGTALAMRVAIAAGLVVVGDLRNEGVVQEHDGRPLPDLAGWGTVSILSVLAGIVVPGQGAGDRSPGFDGGFYVCDILRAARIMVRPVCDSPKTQERTMPIPNTQGTQPVPLFTPWLFVYLAVAMAASFVILLLALLIGLRQTDLPVLSWIYIGLGGI